MDSGLFCWFCSWQSAHGHNFLAVLWYLFIYINKSVEIATSVCLRAHRECDNPMLRDITTSARANGAIAPCLRHKHKRLQKTECDKRKVQFDAEGTSPTGQKFNSKLWRETKGSRSRPSWVEWVRQRRRRGQKASLSGVVRLGMRTNYNCSMPMLRPKWRTRSVWFQRNGLSLGSLRIISLVLIPLVFWDLIHSARSLDLYNLGRSLK